MPNGFDFVIRLRLHQERDCSSSTGVVLVGPVLSGSIRVYYYEITRTESHRFNQEHYSVNWLLCNGNWPARLVTATGQVQSVPLVESVVYQVDRVDSGADLVNFTPGGRQSLCPDEHALSHVQTSILFPTNRRRVGYRKPHSHTSIILLLCVPPLMYVSMRAMFSDTACTLAEAYGGLEACSPRKC